MYPPFDDKGKIFTDIVRKQKEKVVIYTTLKTIIQGKLHIRLDNRIKDELDNDEKFIAITDATISDIQGNKMYSTDFIAINRSQIVYLFPKPEEDKTGDNS